MAIVPPQQQQGPTVVSPGPNVDNANQIVQNNLSATNHNPGLAGAAIQSGNPDTATTLFASSQMAHTANAVDDHIKTYNSGGWISNIFKDAKDIGSALYKGVTDIPVAGKAIGTALNWANKPLQEIQKDYKFIHSLYADHGLGAGLLGTLGVLGGGTIGFFTGFGPEGAALGAEAGAALTRNILGRVTPAYKDSFNKSNDPNSLISFGRDLAHGLSYIPGFRTLSNTNQGFGQIVSGIADASFDFEGDPIATAGRLKSQIVRGDFVGVARDDAGNILKDVTGKPIARATLPWATSGSGIQNFFLANSKKVVSADQIDTALNSGIGGGVNRAIDDIVEKAKNPKTAPADIALTYGNQFGWSRNVVNALAKVTDRDQVIQIFKQAVYSKELADSSNDAIAEFRLPSKSLGKVFSENWGVDRIRKSEQGTVVSEERNLLLPSRSPIMEPAVDANKQLIIDPNTNQPLMQPKVDSQGRVMYKMNRSMFMSKDPGVAMNALAAKVRTFTGRRPLSFDTETNELSNREIDFSDPNVAKTLYDIGYLALPHNVALERASDILLEPDMGKKLAKLHTLNQEVIKAYGLGDTQATAILGEAKKAISGNEFESGNYGFNQSNPINAIEQLPEYGGEMKPMGIVAGHQYKGQMLDLKELRDALRKSKAYGAMYAKGDDFFTKYTNLVFAPLTLLSSAFGLRVSAGEALHQVMRRGLGSYLNDVLATSLRRMDAKYQAYHKDAIAQGLTETDKDAIEAGKTDVPITENEQTKELHQTEMTMKSAWQRSKQAVGDKRSWNEVVNNVRDARYAVMPVGWVANKFLKSNLVPYTVRQKIQFMDEFHRVMGVDGSTAGVAGAHQASADLYTKEQIDMFTKTHGHSNVPGQELAGLTKTDPHFQDYWAKNLGMASMDPAQRDIAQAYLENLKKPGFKAMSPNEQFADLVDGQAARIKDPAKYKDLRTKLDGYTKAVPESFAKAQVDYLQGLVHGSDGTVHTDLIKKVANGELFTGKELRKRDIASAPSVVLGRRVQPTMSDALRRAEEIGYRRFVNPIMDNVSRHPLFMDFYTRRRIINDDLVKMGLIDPEQAVRKSAMEATKEMIPAIHSPAIRSQFAVLHRNLLPFYFAQEQAMRRTGRLILQNPQAFRDFQIINQGMNNPGFIHTDANGQKYIVYPMVGEFGSALVRGLNALGIKQFTGLPESISGTTNSLLTVFPEIKVPSVGPFVNLGMSELSKVFPWMDKLTGVATGGFPATNWQTAILPNSALRDMFNAMTMDERESSVYNSKISAIAAAYYHGDLPDNFASLLPEQQQLYLDKIEHNAQSNLIIKGLLSFFLPLSPSVSNDYVDKNLQSLRSEYLNLLKAKDPSTGKPYTAAAALNKFIQDNGTKALSYTVARTTSGSGSAYVPLSDQALTWINSNKSLINNPAYSIAAPYLIPQTGDTTDSLQVEQKMLANHFRSKATPQEFLSSLYVKKGWQDIAPEYSAYQSMMNDARKAGNKNMMYQITQAWKTVSANYGANNPIWYADYNNPTRLEFAQNAVTQFQKISEKGLIPNTVEGNGIKDLLANYDYYHRGLIANTLPGGKHSPGYGLIQDAWFTYLDSVEASNPRLQSVVTGVFRRVK